MGLLNGLATYQSDSAYDSQDAPVKLLDVLFVELIHFGGSIPIIEKLYILLRLNSG